MEMQYILSRKLCFEEKTVSALEEFVDHLGRNQWRASVSMASVFVEHLLWDISRFFGIEMPQSFINERIMTCMTHVMSMSEISKAEKRRLVDLLRCCDRIRRMRNRFVHYSWDSEVESRKYAVAVLEDVVQIVQLYEQTTMGMSIRNRRAEAGESDAKSVFTVFISSIVPCTVEQERFLNAVCGQLRDMGIKAVRSDPRLFVEMDPLELIHWAIDSCQAVLVLGLEQRYAMKYWDKHCSASVEDRIRREDGPNWMHIEIAMAVALQKKMFIMSDMAIPNSRIFDRYRSSPVLAFTTPLDIYDRIVQNTLGQIKECAEQVGL